MALIRSYSQIEERRRAGELTLAEEQLLAECRSGEPVVLGDGTRPQHASPERTIRADLLRYLILGGCEAFRTHERGIQVKGAWIDGHLDLAFATARGATLLTNCVFPEGINASQAHLQQLDLEGGRLKGLLANNCHVAGDVWLDRIESSRAILLAGATIGGQLTCQNARLAGFGGLALEARGARVAGDVFLDRLSSASEVRLSAAIIGGRLSCTGSMLDGGFGNALSARGTWISGDVFLWEMTSSGEINFSGATVGGHFTCQGARLNGADGKALNAERLRVDQAFIWCGLADVVGDVNLSAAHFAELADSSESWDRTASFSLVGLTIDRLVGPFELEMRLAWLRKGSKLNGAFSPLPYLKFAEMLRASGHRAEARAVLIEKERDQRRAARERALDGVSGFPGRALVHAEYLPHRIWSWLIGWATGYGYAPWRIIRPLIIMIALQAVLAFATWNAGDFAPNSDVVLVSEGWTAIANAPGGQVLDANCLREGGGEPCLSLPGLSVNAAAIWSSATGPGRDYESFNALSYAADVVLPLVELGQEAAWAPSPARGPWGWFAHHAQKVFVILGWIVAAIFAGAVTGIIRRDD